MQAADRQDGRARRMARRGTALGAVGVALGLMAATPAQGGSFAVDVCRDWSSGAPVGAPDELSRYGFRSVTNACAAGGPLAGQLASPSLMAGDYANFGFAVPGSAPNLRITRIQARYSASATIAGMATVQLLSNGAVQRHDLAPNPVVFDEPAPAGARDVKWQLTCERSGEDCAFPSASDLLELRSARLTVEDPAAPAGAVTGGTLLSGGAQRGTRAIAASVTDADAGVRRVSVRLGGVVAGETLLSCTTGSWTPCPRAKTAVDVPVDTTKVADGSHDASLLVEDAAGNTTAVQAGTVQVDNVPPPDATRAPSLSGTAAQGQTLVLDPGAWDGHGQTVTLEYRWQRSTDGTTWVDLPAAGGDPAHRVMGADDVSARVRAVVRASSPEGSRDVVAGTSEVVAPAPVSGGPGSGLPVPGAPDAVVPVVVLPSAGGLPAPAAPVVGALNSASGRPGDRMLISVLDRRRAARMRYGAPIAVTGVLRDAGGRPVPGARVEVLEVPAGGGSARPVGTVVTDAAGRFAHRPRTGPSRTLRFAYRAHHGDVSFTSTQDVALKVVAAIALRTDKRTLRNRQLLTFRGTVRGTSGRKLVELQVRRGTQWMTFATTFTHRGAFRYRYRFMRTRTTTRFDFRARVRKDAGFPYETASSRALRVLVRGGR